MADTSNEDIQQLLDRQAQVNEEATRVRNQNKLMLQKIKQHRQQDARKEQEQAEKLARLKAQQAQQEEEEDEDFPMPVADDAQADAALGLQEDPEPPSCNDALFAPLQQPTPPPLDFSAIAGVLSGADHAHSATFHALLHQQQLLLSPTPQLLQLLFQAAVSTGNELAALQLEEHYKGLPPGEAPSWSPSLESFLCSLKDLGFTTSTTASGQLDRGKAQQSAAASQQAAGTTTSVADKDTIAVPDQQQQAQGQTRELTLDEQARHRLAATCIQTLLRLLCTVCQKELQDRTGTWADLSRTGKAAGVELLMALLQLHLVPSLCRVALLELGNATTGLVQAWSTCSPSTWDKHVMPEVATRVANLGPSYMAALAVIKEIPAQTTKAQQLQMACLLMLQASLHKSKGSATSASDAAKAAISGEAGRMSWSLLQAVADKGTKLKDAVQHTGDSGVKGKPDYYRIMALLECTHMVLWCLVYQQESEKDRALTHQFFVYLQRVYASLGMNRNATVAKLQAVLAEWQNNWEFTADIKHEHAQLVHV